MATKQRLIEVLTTAMEKPDIANALIQRVINELKKEWVGLTDEDKRKVCEMTERDDRGYVMAIVEEKLKEKNT